MSQLTINEAAWRENGLNWLLKLVQARKTQKKKYRKTPLSRKCNLRSRLPLQNLLLQINLMKFLIQETIVAMEAKAEMSASDQISSLENCLILFKNPYNLKAKVTRCLRQNLQQACQSLTCRVQSVSNTLSTVRHYTNHTTYIKAQKLQKVNTQLVRVTRISAMKLINLVEYKIKSSRIQV